MMIYMLSFHLPFIMDPVVINLKSKTVRNYSRHNFFFETSEEETEIDKINASLTSSRDKY